MRREFIRLPPKGETQLPMESIQVGQWVAVWECYEGCVVMDAQVVLIIEAGVKPDPVALAPLFTRQALATTLKHVPVPTRPSKYRRLLLETKPGGGRAFVYPCNPDAYRFLATVIPARFQ